MEAPLRSSCPATMILVTLLGLAAAGCTTPPATTPPLVTTGPVAADTHVPDDAPPTVTTTALDGNRVVAGRLADVGPVRLAADLVPSVLLAAPVADGMLLVASDRATSHAWVLTDEGVGTAPRSVLDGLGPPPPEGRPALVRDDDHWRFAPSTGPGDADWQAPAGDVRRDGTSVRFGAATVDDVLPDARWAVEGTRLVVPVGPTTSYGHAVLGDGVEARGIAVADAATGRVERTDLPPGVVLEGTGVILADLDGDGTTEPVFTVADARVGARQAVLLDGRVVEGPAIGRGNRWRHLLGVADGRLHEVVTPHLTQTHQVLVLDGGTMTVAHATEGTIASHTIGSRDLDRATLVDATGDGVADAVGPAAGRAEALQVVDGADGTTVRLVDLGSTVTSNVLGFRVGQQAVVAVGTDAGGVLLLGFGQ